MWSLQVHCAGVPRAVQLLLGNGWAYIHKSNQRPRPALAVRLQIALLIWRAHHGHGQPPHL